jgi:hypothetical protein
VSDQSELFFNYPSIIKPGFIFIGDKNVALKTSKLNSIKASACHF